MTSSLNFFIGSARTVCDAGFALNTHGSLVKDWTGLDTYVATGYRGLEAYGDVAKLLQFTRPKCVLLFDGEVDLLVRVVFDFF